MKLPMLSLTPKILIFAALLFVGIPISLFLLNQQQDTRGEAWETDQSASAVCDSSSGKVVIESRFTNTEPNQPEFAMKVTVRDNVSGNQADLGKVNPGETKNGKIQTGATSTSGGTVTFLLIWADGHSGTDTRTASYQSVAACPQPTTVPPTPTIKLPTNTPIPPTAVPPTSTPQPTPTLIPTKIPTPTVIPPTEVLSTPTGSISSCPVPKKVQNIKVTCPFCP